MSSIKIECRKSKYKGKSDDAEKDLVRVEKLSIETSQLFLNTNNFFNNIRASLEKYFDTIEKK